MRQRLLYSLIVSTSICAQVCSNEKPHNDLLPLARLECAARFWDDEAAFPVLYEFGNRMSRINASVAFPICYGHNFKIGGEALNEQLTYEFPHKNEKRWVNQSAIGATYQAVFNYCGFRSLELSAQYSTAPNRKLHDFHKEKQEHGHRHHSRKESDHDKQHRGRLHELRQHHRNQRHRDGYHRSIAGSKAYAFSAGFTSLAWNGACVSASALYDHVEYRFKFEDHKIVNGFGGTVFYKQELCPCIDFVVKGEFRKPYDYYEGRLQWDLFLDHFDMTFGLYGGHTIGKHGLPNSTVAGFEMGFDFGITNFSGSASSGLCSDNSNPYFGGFAGQNPQILHWTAAPAVYIPEVMALPEQRHFRK